MKHPPRGLSKIKIPKLNRRRFITISAAAAGVVLTTSMRGLGKGLGEGGALPQLVQWRGAALGAEARIMLYTDDPASTDELFVLCQQEITRLEKIFSLYRPDSQISRLNRQGYLDNPDIELVDLLSRSMACTEITGGAFDVTIQPLWQLYAAHFAKPGADPYGPGEEAVARTLELVGSDKIELSARRISFRRKGMGISMNGVAQGYITDRVAKMLEAAGYGNLLVHMGESYAMGQHADGRPWTAGISSPLEDKKILKMVPLHNQALATSGGYGSPFSDQSKLHHLLDPKTGKSANHHGSVSVIARDTTTADMLSTALFVMPFHKVATVWYKYPQIDKVIFVDKQGNVIEMTG